MVLISEVFNTKVGPSAFEASLYFTSLLETSRIFASIRLLSRVTIMS